jgi:hypothetical protein
MNVQSYSTPYLGYHYDKEAAIGHDGRRLIERSDGVSSVVYWNQMEPHASFPALPNAEARWPR